MKITVNEYSFRREFANFNRDGQFTYAALDALFEYLEELERDCGEEYELDVVALCCDFAEDSAEDICIAYGVDITGMDEAAIIAAGREYLEEESALIAETHEGVFLYRQH